MHTNFKKRKSFYSPLPKKWHNFSDFSSLCIFIKINNRSKKSAIISTTSSAKKDSKYSKNKVITTEENPDKEATTVTFQEPNIKKHKQKRKQRKFLEV